MRFPALSLFAGRAGSSSNSSSNSNTTTANNNINIEANKLYWRANSKAYRQILSVLLSNTGNQRFLDMKAQ